MIVPRRGRRWFLRTGLVAGAAVLGAGAWTRYVSPYALGLTHLELDCPRWPATLDGLRVAHLSDLHAGRGVKDSYLQASFDRLIEQRPDLVCVTGDLISTMPQAVPLVRELFRSLVDALGVPVMVCFGNHDYTSESAVPGPRRLLADALERGLSSVGVVVLRNRSVTVFLRDTPLTIAGVEDLYTSRFDPRATLREVDLSRPLILLVHNPDGVGAFGDTPAVLTLCGHTHGGQVRLPLIGAPVLPIRDKRFDMGLFKRGDGWMYVSRGVGFVRQIRLNCPPEVPIYTLRHRQT